MRRLLAKAFVTTVSLVACGKTTSPAPEQREPSHNPPAPVVDAAASAEPVLQTRLRKRTKPATYPPSDGTKPNTQKLLNPKDASGRMIFTRPDDICMVEGTPKEPRPQSLPPGLPWRSLERIDCPPEMDDPAFDDCTDRLVLDEAAGTCFCVTSFGNPPPPPRPNVCPNGAAKPKRSGS